MLFSNSLLYDALAIFVVYFITNAGSALITYSVMNNCEENDIKCRENDAVAQASGWIMVILSFIAICFAILSQRRGMGMFGMGMGGLGMGGMRPGGFGRLY